jgi:hypothetical protein
MAESRNAQSLSELFSELSRESSTLMRQQIELAKVELSDKMSRLGAGLARVVVGGLLATGGLLVILAAVVLGVVAMGVPAWLAALLVGLVVSFVGYLLAQQAIAAMGREDLAPRTTIDTLKESAEWVKSPTKT